MFFRANGHPKERSARRRPQPKLDRFTGLSVRSLSLARLAISVGEHARHFQANTNKVPTFEYNETGQPLDSWEALRLERQSVAVGRRASGSDTHFGSRIRIDLTPVATQLHTFATRSFAGPTLSPKALNSYSDDIEMPILGKEATIYPNDLFENPDTGNELERKWWVLYTLSRREKELVRRLTTMEIPFYCPITPQRYRSPAGRIRTSYLPLFTNYVFLYGTEQDRYNSLTTKCVARDIEVTDGVELTRDLRQLHEIIETGAALTRESKLEPGQKVRIKTGAFRNYEGYIVRREGQTRLLIAVNFLQQGASVLLDDCEVEPA